MAVFAGALAAGWIPFVIVCALTLLFAIIYVQYFQSRHDSELFSSLACIAGIAIALLTCALVPVDIFLVSFMKNNDGTFKEWAQDASSRQTIVNGVLYTYYILYAVVILFVFFVFPCVYFFYEEKDDEEEGETPTAKRCRTAVKYSLVVLSFGIVLLLIGAFVPFRAISHNNVTDTEWEKIEDIFDNFTSNRAEDMISFTISALTLLGMFCLVTYTGYGLFAWPLDFVKGRRSVESERREVTSTREEIQAKIDAIRNKSRSRRRLSRRNWREIDELEDEVDLLDRRERHLRAAEKSCLNTVARILRPFQIVFGVVFLLFAFIVAISLLLTNIDKLLHSLGPKTGYSLPRPVLPNPIDITLLFAQKVFPIDYILMAALIMYFFFCSMGGIQNIGIWFCWLKMYKIRVGQTKPQGLLFLVFILMFTVLAINVLFYEIAPQYSTFGSQHYLMNKTDEKGVNSTVLVACSTAAPSDECVMTRMTMLLVRFFYKIWFFGVVYYWSSWLFLVVSLISLVVCIVKKRRSSMEGVVDADDMADSDEELVVP